MIPSFCEPQVTEKFIPEKLLPLWGMDYEHYALYGGRGGAKSHGIAEPIVYHSCQRHERVVCGREYQNSIRDSVKELLEKKIYEMGMAAYFRSTEREIINVSTRSRFSFVGMNRNPESAKSLEGATIFWGEEAQTFTRHSVEIIIPTIRAQGSRLYWSWNPRFREDPVDEMFRGPEPPENCYITEVSFEDNPWFYQTRMPSEERRMRRAKPARWAHVWGGGYDESPEIAIFSDWEEGDVEVPLKVQPRFGLDFGYSIDPSALIKAYVLEDIDTIYVAEEAYGHQVPNRHLPDLLDTVSESRAWPITADSARPETIEYLNSCGFNIFSARKGKGSIKNGISYIQGFRLLISPRCPNFKEEVRKYLWSTDPTGKPLPIPAPGQADHGIDGLRYALEEDSTNAGAGTGGVVYI